MIVFPHCKINLGLRILRKRNDGYHDIETVFYPVAQKDVLEIIESKNQAGFTATGIDAGEPKDNLCVKAYNLLKSDFPSLPPVQMHLHKTIPTGAGLGGGSADAAFTLLLLNKKFALNLSTEKFTTYALQLGSDCPFFIQNTAVYATGRGEITEPIHTDLSAYKLLLVHPGIHSSTAEAFKKITPSHPAVSLKDIIRLPVEEWKGKLINDFENPLFEQYPVLKSIRENLYKHGAVYAAMSGSGSALYGIFPKESQLQLSFPQNYFVKELPGQFQ